MRSWLTAAVSALGVGAAFFSTPVSARFSDTKEEEGGRRPPYLRTVAQDLDHVRLEIRIPPRAFRLHVDADGARSLDVPGLSARMTPGEPELPALVASVGVPEGVDVRLSWTASEETVVVGPPLRPVARIDRETGDLVREAGAAIYASDGPWPEERITLEEVRYRGLRLARLVVHPARYDPSTRELRLTSAFDVRLDFAGGEGSPRAVGPFGPAEETVVREILVNGESLDTARRVASGAADEPAPAAPTAQRAVANPGVKIRVNAEGLVRVTQADLVALGFDPVPVDPRNLEMSFRGTPIPCRVRGEADASFDPGDEVEFYGVPNTGRYSTENVYWLEEKATPGLRFATRSATPGGAALATQFPHTVHYEPANTIYTYGHAAQEGEPRWFWVWFEQSNPNPPRVETLTHATGLPGLTAGSTAKIRAFFAGENNDGSANPDHAVRFTVNGTQVGQTSWEGFAFHTGEIPFDPALLLPATNSFKLDLVHVGLVSRFFLDWIEVQYPRSLVAASDRLTIVGEGGSPLRYSVTGLASVADPLVLDVTNPMAPIELAGWSVTGAGPFALDFEESVPAGKRYHVAADGGRVAPAGLVLDVPSSLKGAGNGADLIVVVPPGWESALAPLVAQRQAQGLRVVLASVTDVADEFAGGNVDDIAIRDFIAHAYATWQPPAVSHLLLVGEPNQDALNYLGQSPFYHLMPIHFGVTAALGETMTDTWFGAVAGADLLPDVGVGRLSVRTAPEAAAVVAKILAYENAPPNGAAWSKNVVQIASNATDEIFFEAPLEEAAAYLPSHFTVDSQYRRLGATTSSIVDAFEAGGVMVSFLGHGNYDLWADSSTFGGPFFWNSTALGLENEGRLPFVTALNCLNGMVGHPVATVSMAEAFVNLPVTGAHSIWSSSALGFLGEYKSLQNVLYRTIYEDRVPWLGTATNSALVETYLTAPVSLDLVKEMLLVGDPSSWLAIDTDNDVFMDVVEYWHGLDPADRDSDDDGLLEPFEGLEADPAADADDDGRVNGLDPDSDNDGLPDGLEAGQASPSPDTDVSAGNFRADTHPASTTSPVDPDTDGGGAPDGAEDRDANGAVGPGETNPFFGSDDPACAGGIPPEVAASPGKYLMLSKSGANVVLSWGDATAADPCLLYAVYVADDFDKAAGRQAFSLLAVTGMPGHTQVGGLSDGLLHRYVVVGTTLVGGEGPWGHFGF